MSSIRRRSPKRSRSTSDNDKKRVGDNANAVCSQLEIQRFESTFSSNFCDRLLTCRIGIYQNRADPGITIEEVPSRPSIHSPLARTLPLNTISNVFSPSPSFLPTLANACPLAPDLTWHVTQVTHVAGQTMLAKPKSHHNTPQYQCCIKHRTY